VADISRVETLLVSRIISVRSLGEQTRPDAPRRSVKQPGIASRSVTGKIRARRDPNPHHSTCLVTCIIRYEFLKRASADKRSAGMDGHGDVSIDFDMSIHGDVIIPFAYH
jgi:hypothetical protein